MMNGKQSPAFNNASRGRSTPSLVQNRPLVPFSHYFINMQTSPDGLSEGAEICVCP